MTDAEQTAVAEKLTSYIERIENLIDQIEGLKDDLKDVKAQARDEGFNVLALLKLISIRRNKRQASRETELLNDLVLYAHATGTPLDFTFGDDEPSRPARQRPPMGDPAAEATAEEERMD